MISTALRDKVAAIKAEAEAARSRLEDWKVRLEEARKDEKEAAEARDLVQRAGEAVQRQAHDGIAAVVARCLEAVYPGECGFRIDFEKKRGRTEARLVFLKDGNEMAPGTVAGGHRDVASFALRVACIMLSRPPIRRLLVADEPFRHVDAARRPVVAALVQAVADELGLQIVMVTHDSEFAIGEIVEIG